MKKLIALMLFALFALPSTALAAETGIAQPDLFWYETDAEGVMESVGVRFGVPSDAENVVYRLPEDNRMAEMQFTLNGIAHVARIQPTAAFENISGVQYAEWAISDDCMIGWCEAQAMMTRDGENIVALCLWYDAAPGIMYSVTAASRDFLGLDIQAAAEAIFLPMQDDADGLTAEELFAALTACTGYAGSAGSSLKGARAACSLAAFAAEKQLANADERYLSEAIADALAALSEEQKAELSFNLPSIHTVLTGAFENYESVRGLFEDSGCAEDIALLLADPSAAKHFSALFDQLLAAGL